MGMAGSRQGFACCLPLDRGTWLRVGARGTASGPTRVCGLRTQTSLQRLAAARGCPLPNAVRCCDLGAFQRKPVQAQVARCEATELEVACAVRSCAGCSVPSPCACLSGSARQRPMSSPGAGFLLTPQKGFPSSTQASVQLGVGGWCEWCQALMGGQAAVPAGQQQYGRRARGQVPWGWVVRPPETGR